MKQESRCKKPRNAVPQKKKKTRVELKCSVGLWVCDSARSVREIGFLMDDRREERERERGVEEEQVGFGFGFGFGYFSTLLFLVWLGKERGRE